jgi:hypothetical protein
VKLQFFIKKSQMFFPAVNSLKVLVITTLDPDRIGIQPKMLDPDPASVNTDPKHCLLAKFKLFFQEFPN